MTSHRRGDIVLVMYPDSNLRTAKRRPALVIQADQLTTGLPQFIVAMISGNVSRAGHASRVLVEVSAAPGQQSGLKMDSVIMTDNLATVLESEIDRTIGTWTEMSRVDLALRHTLQL